MKLKDISKESLQAACDSCNSISEIIKSLDLGGNTCSHARRKLEERILKEKIDLTLYFENQKNRNPYASKSNPSKSFVFNIKDYRVKGGHLKKNMLKVGVKNQCSKCGINDFYNGLPLSLQVDHMNGDPLDNRIENLRFLCPNCHSQTETWCAKNRKIKIHQKNKRSLLVADRTTNQNGKTFCACGAKKCKKANFCASCHKKKNLWSAPYKSLDYLIAQIRDLGYEGVGKIFNVSGNSVRKWVEKEGLNPLEIKKIPKYLR